MSTSQLGYIVQPQLEIVTPAAVATNASSGNIRLAPGLANGTGVQGTIIKRIPLLTSAVAAAGVATVNDLLSGFISVGVGAVADYIVTTPTGTLISAAIPDVAVGDSFEVLIVNSIAQILRWTAGAGVTVVGVPTLAASGVTKAVFWNTGANAWSTMLLNN